MALMELKNLTKAFGKVVTAAGLNLAFEEGVLTSIIGPNGAGKSTLINMITGAIPPDSGAIYFMDTDITRLPTHERVRMGLGRSFQIVNVFRGLSVLENVLIPVLARLGLAARPFKALAAHTPALSEAEKVLELVGLSDKRWLTASQLSHGDQRVLEVAMALAAGPRLLLLDEPTAGMNPVERRQILGTIRQLHERGEVSFIIVEHDMDIVFSLSERIIVLNRGEVICDGPPEVVRSDRGVRECYLGEEVGDGA